MYGDWTKKQAKSTIIRALENEGSNEVTLNCENSSHWNMLEIVSWAKELGYNAELLPGDASVTVWK